MAKKNTLEIALQFFQLLVGNPKLRIPKTMILAGIFLLVTHWWQPIVESIAVLVFDFDRQFLEWSATTAFLNGWGLISLGSYLYLQAYKKNANDIMLRDVRPSF